MQQYFDTLPRNKTQLEAKLSKERPKLLLKQIVSTVILLAIGAVSTGVFCKFFHEESSRLIVSLTMGSFFTPLLVGIWRKKV